MSFQFPLRLLFLLHVVGAICAAFYLLIGLTLRQRLSLLAYATLCYGSASLVLVLLVLAVNAPVVGYPLATVGVLFGMALVSQIMGHTAYNWALRWFSAGFVAVALLGEPILATIGAYFLFNEGLSWSQVGGVGMNGGLVMVSRGQIGTP